MPTAQLRSRPLAPPARSSPSAAARTPTTASPASSPRWAPGALSTVRGRTVLALHAPHRGPALWLIASRAAIAALELGAAASVVRDGVTAYRGVSRRLELRHSGNGVLMLDDYAHNPAQIGALAEALRGHYPQRRLIAVFEPRQHRRTALYCVEFGQALA